jgi:hypothetical protein
MKLLLCILFNVLDIWKVSLEGDRSVGIPTEEYRIVLTVVLTILSHVLQ